MSVGRNKKIGNILEYKVDNNANFVCLWKYRINSTIVNDNNFQHQYKNYSAILSPQSMRTDQSFTLGLIHTVRFFLIATAILLIATNGLYRTQWKCSHSATATRSPTLMQLIMSKNKSQSQIAQCEQTLRAVQTQPWQRRRKFLEHLSKFSSFATAISHL